MLLSKLSNKNAHMSTSSIRMISFFNVQCELFTSCNLSNILSLVSPQGSGGGGGQPNVDRYGQGGREVQKFPNLCRHPLCMTPTTTQKKMLVVQQKQNKNVLFYVLTNLKTCNSINPWFVAFLRLPLSIQKYLIAYYTI